MKIIKYKYIIMMIVKLKAYVNYIPQTLLKCFYFFNYLFPFLKYIHMNQNI